MSECILQACWGHHRHHPNSQCPPNTRCPPWDKRVGPQSHPKEKKKELCQDRPLANSHPCQTHSALHHSGYTCLLCYLASILPPLHIASTQHVLLDSVGFFRHRINVVQAATGFTADEWYLELLQRPGSLEAHCGDKMWLLMIHNLSQPPFLDLWHPVPHLT